MRNNFQINSCIVLGLILVTAGTAFAFKNGGSSYYTIIATACILLGLITFAKACMEYFLAEDSHGDPFSH